jgi:NADH-quinone oxidoreductase subunit C/D
VAVKSFDKGTMHRGDSLFMRYNPDILQDLQERFGTTIVALQATVDGIPTVWVNGDGLHEVLQYLKVETEKPYRMLYDCTCIDERSRSDRNGQPRSDFTLVYHLLSFDRNEDIRIKVPLFGEFPTFQSIVDLWPSANWYEREIWDMFGISFSGHPHLRRILLPPTWEGHPLRKEYPARATETGPVAISEDEIVAAEEALQFRPEHWGMQSGGEDSDLMFLNVGPNHPSTHGLFRMVIQVDGEEIVDSALDIGFHHRGAEKMGERQTWHTFIPYTDRIDYLAGVMNNFPYILAVEKLAGIEVPQRAQVIRVMMAELFRIASHLVFYGTFAADVGAMTPVFYMFNDRERVFKIVQAICGGRMHPSWFRIGGVAQDLPQGWDEMIREFINYLPEKLDEYEKLVMGNRIFKARTMGIGTYTVDEAIEWGVSGAGLRACGLEWDLRKHRPYSGYDQFEFDIPTAPNGDCYDRGRVRVEEIRQSLRIIEQCVNNMPEGHYRADHPLAMPPRKERTMQDIETLINHFVGVAWGPVMPAGESFSMVEGTKGNTGYYLISDGNNMSYRTRIRTPSFAHLQMVPHIARGLTIADLVVILGSVDYVMADSDR